MRVLRTRICLRDDSLRKPSGHDSSIREFPYCLAGLPLPARGFHSLPYCAFLYCDLQGDARVGWPGNGHRFPVARLNNQFSGLPALFLLFVVAVADAYQPIPYCARRCLAPPGSGCNVNRVRIVFSCNRTLCSEPVCWTSHATASAVQDMGVNHGCTHIAMAE